MPSALFDFGRISGNGAAALISSTKLARPYFGSSLGVHVTSASSCMLTSLPFVGIEQVRSRCEQEFDVDRHCLSATDRHHVHSPLGGLPWYGKHSSGICLSRGVGVTCH